MRLWFDALASHVTADEIKTIVDVGCGTGRFTAILANTFNARVFGSDPSRLAIQFYIRDLHCVTFSV